MVKNDGKSGPFCPGTYISYSLNMPCAGPATSSEELEKYQKLL